MNNYIAKAIAYVKGRTGMLVSMVTAALVSGLILGTGGAASASPPTLPDVPADPTGGAMSETLDGVITWVTTYGVPALAVGILTGILIRLGFKWVRRAGRAIG